MWRICQMIRAPPGRSWRRILVWTYPPYQKHIDQHLTWDYLHNEYLQMQVEYGAVGFGLLMIALAWSGLGTMAAVMKTRGRASAALLAAAAGGLAASLIQALFDFNFHIFPNPHVLLWTGGVAWGVWFMEEGGASLPVGIGGSVLLQPWRGAVMRLGGLASDGRHFYAWNLKAEMAGPDGMGGGGIWYAKAITWDDWNWQPHLAGGTEGCSGHLVPSSDLELNRRGKSAWRRGGGHFQQALARNSCDMAAVLPARPKRAGDSEVALELLRAAAYRTTCLYREQVGIQLVRMKRDREALEVFRKTWQTVLAGRQPVEHRLLERRLAKEAVPASAAP